jgi:DNA-binding sugar fermentation-stimulating protein
MLGTRRIIVLHQIHPAADLISPHQVGDERFQKVADAVRLLKAGVELRVVNVIRQNQGHAVGDEVDALAYRSLPG